MKRVKDGRLSTDQKDWIRYLTESGYTCITCYGAEDAKAQIDAFFEGRE